ncbi:hypothetical protein Tco_0255267 [Tanacetum coccineum]
MLDLKRYTSNGTWSLVAIVSNNSSLNDMEGDDGCGDIMLEAKDMSALVYCILLKGAVDTTMEVKFKANDARLKVKRHICL